MEHISTGSLKVGVKLDLVYDWLDLSNFQNGFDVGPQEARDTNRPGLPRSLHFLHILPSVLKICGKLREVRAVNEVPVMCVNLGTECGTMHVKVATPQTKRKLTGQHNLAAGC